MTKSMVQYRINSRLTSSNEETQSMNELSLTCVDRKREDSFIMSLYHLAEHCNYCDLHDKMIRDQIVVGL